MEKYITKNENETMELGKKLARNFKGGQIVGLEGELGSGKTTLIKGMAKGLGIKRNITSPTFVLMKVYDLRLPTSDLRHLVHVDAYRIEDARELVDIGIEEYINDSNTVVIIEWAEKVKEILPKNTIWVKMGYGKKEDEREIEIIDNS